MSVTCAGTPNLAARSGSALHSPTAVSVSVSGTGPPARRLVVLPGGSWPCPAAHSPALRGLGVPRARGGLGLRQEPVHRALVDDRQPAPRELRLPADGRRRVRRTGRRRAAAQARLLGVPVRNASPAADESQLSRKTPGAGSAWLWSVRYT